jgi:hypothetical protein
MKTRLHPTQFQCTAIFCFATKIANSAEKPR